MNNCSIPSHQTMATPSVKYVGFLYNWGILLVGSL